jgi:serine/threonine-protein kinase RsbW
MTSTHAFGDSDAEDEIVHVRLNLSSSAENVPTVRQALAGFGQAIALQPMDLNDIRTALTEACNNASLHAYADGGEGPMEVELRASADTVAVAVRDRGRGLDLDLDSGTPVSEVDEDGLPRIGLPAIYSLASDVRVSALDGGGTEVAMSFLAPGMSAALDLGTDGMSSEQLSASWGPDVVELDMAPIETARWVFPRVLRAMAVRAHFRIDRLADAQHVATWLIDAAERQGAERVHAAVAIAEHGIDFALGPLTGKEAAALTGQLRDLEPSIEDLPDGRLPAGPALGDRLAFAIPRLPRQEPLAG